MNQALSAAVAQRLVDAHARDLKLTVSDEDLARTVHDEPAFRGEQGFDRSRLDMYLRGNNMSEQGFLAMIRDDTLRQRLLQSMTAPVTAPADVAQRLLAYRDEQRSGRVLMVDASGMQVEAPDDAALKAYLDANAKKYEAPEFRTVTLVLLSPDDLANEIKVDDAAVKAEYDNRIGEFTTPETRSFDQLVAPDEAVIRQAQQMAAQGQGFDAIAAALKDKGVDRTQLADVKKGELPDALDKAVFGTAQDAVAEPVEDPFGWHLLRVTAVKPQAVRGFDEVKDQLAHDLALQQANDQLPKLSTKLDDAIAAGTPLDQAAEQVGTKALKVDAVDKQGQDKAGQPAGGGKLTPEMLDAIFAAPAGQPSLMNQLKDGRYYVFRVDNIEPAHPRPLDEVREQVANDWKQDQQGKKAKAEAEELRTKVTDAQSLDAVAAGQPGASVRPVGPLKRTDQGFQQGLRPDAVAAIFRTPAGSVAPGVVEGLDGWAIVAVDQVSRAQAGPGPRRQGAPGAHQRHAGRHPPAVRAGAQGALHRLGRRAAARPDDAGPDPAGAVRAVDARPSADEFAAAYARGEAQVVWTSLIADLETPVSAYAEARPTGGPTASCSRASRAARSAAATRSSALKPDLVWRCRGERAEINRRARADRRRRSSRWTSRALD